MSWVDPSVAGTPTSGAPVSSAWGQDVQADEELFETEITTLQSEESTLSTDVTALDTDSGWITFTVLSGFTVASGTAYRKIGAHTVRYRGEIISGTSGNQWTTMPAGYIPPSAQPNPVSMSAVGATSTMASVTIQTASGAGGTGPGAVFAFGTFPIRIDGISYPID
jgi:hypothetical protein